MAQGILLTKSTLTGKIGGLYFRDHKGTSIMSSKKKPVNTHGNRKSTRINFVVRYASSWRFISRSQRLAWLNASYNGMSGYTLFMSCCLNRSLLQGFAVPLFSPPKQIPAINVLSVDASSGSFKNFSYQVSGGANNDYGLVLESTAPLSAGVFRPSASDFKFTSQQLTLANGTYSFSTAYDNLYGDSGSSNGRKLFIRIRLIDRMTGYAGQWIYASTTF